MIILLDTDQLTIKTYPATTHAAQFIYDLNKLHNWGNEFHKMFEYKAFNTDTDRDVTDYVSDEVRAIWEGK